MRISVIKTYLIIALVCLMGCTEVHTSKLVNPILNMEVVEIPSQGKVVFIVGDAELIKKERATVYQKVETGTIINGDDILWMKPDCIAKIEFEDGSYIQNEKQEKEVFITFEFVKTKDVLK